MRRRNEKNTSVKHEARRCEATENAGTKREARGNKAAENASAKRKDRGTLLSGHFASLSIRTLIEPLLAISHGSLDDNINSFLNLMYSECNATPEV